MRPSPDVDTPSDVDTFVDPETTIVATINAPEGGTLIDGSLPGNFIESVTLFNDRRLVIGDVLGSGGMSHVKKTHDNDLQISVALKGDKVGDENGARCLVREHEILSAISHPNVVSVHGIGRLQSDGRVYLVMELVDGVDLREWLKEVRSWQEILSIFMKAGEGLVATHRAGFVHRDFKPGNVMVEGNAQQIKIIDYDLARPIGDSATELDSSHPQKTEIRKPEGTFAYMPPEQYDVGPVDAKSDQFSFCVALYEALYGETPFDGEPPYGIYMNIEQGNLRSPAKLSFAPDELQEILRRGLSFKLEDRWPSMRALLDAIQAALVSFWRRRFEEFGLSLDAVESLVTNIPIGREFAHANAQIEDSWGWDSLGQGDVVHVVENIPANRNMALANQ